MEERSFFRRPTLPINQLAAQLSLFTIELLWLHLIGGLSGLVDYAVSGSSRPRAMQQIWQRHSPSCRAAGATSA